MSYLLYYLVLNKANFSHYVKELMPLENNLVVLKMVLHMASAPLRNTG